MGRPIVLSNGELHVGLNYFGMVHDFYYPYVGYENHSAGENMRHNIGIWVDGQISWIDEDPSWSFTYRYPHSALIGHIIAKNERIGVVLEFDDFVDVLVSAFIRNIHVVNLFDRDREIRLFMHQAFIIGDSRSNTDTGQYLPDSDAILHYRGRRAFVVSGDNNGQPFDQYTIGLFGIEGREGTFRDADDGELNPNSVEHGRVDSTIRFKMNISANSSNRIHYWIAAGMSTREALRIHKLIKDDGAFAMMSRTADWWNNWLKPAYEVLGSIEPSHQKSFIQSLMIIKSQIDNHGAIIASTDTSMLNYSRDAYAYSWPRDGAYTLWPLIRMGYKDEAIKFFEFTKRGINNGGYLMHKYRADGALGSSWHSYLHNGVITPPIQEDETAILLFIFAQYYQINPSADLLKEFYKSLVVPMADFLMDFVDRETGLPKPSYDLWEEIFATFTYTTATVVAALHSASDIAMSAHDQNNAVKWRVAGNEIQAAAHKYLYNETRKTFYKSVSVKDGEIISKDETIDCSSLFGAYTFGLFASDSTEIKSSIETLKQVFGINDGKMGLPRYENDDYHRVNPKLQGNYWYVTTFWLAQYYIDIGMFDEAVKILNWAKSHSLRSGVMGEQIEPTSDQLVAPAPLTWTHAEYITTLLNLSNKTKK